MFDWCSSSQNQEKSENLKQPRGVQENMKTKCNPECNLGTEIRHQVKNEEIHIQCGLQIIIICQYRLINFDKCATLMGFPSGSVVKNLPANAGDTNLIPGSGRSSGGGNDNPLQYSCLEEEPGGLQFMGLQRVEHD